LAGVVEHVVIEHVVAHRQQVHPVARFRHLQQPALVHVLIIEPAERLVDRRPVLLQEGQIVRVLEVEIVAEDEPQVGIDRAGVLGADIARVRVDVERDQPAPGLMLAERFQRGAPGVDQAQVAGADCAQKGDRRVARPHLRIARRHSRCPIAVACGALVQNVGGLEMRFLDQLDVEHR
jgi:hypothetical protein